MRRLPLALLLVALASCDRSVPALTLPPTDAAVAGSYGLTLVNGRSLPFPAVITSDAEYDLTSDRIDISTEGTWSETTNYNVISLSNSAVTTQQTVTSGTYTVSPTVITFTRVSGGALIFTGSVTGTTLSLLFNGGAFIYVR